MLLSKNEKEVNTQGPVKLVAVDECYAKTCSGRARGTGLGAVTWEARVNTVTGSKAGWPLSSEVLGKRRMLSLSGKKGR